MGLLTDLGPGPVALDSSIFIYFIEENPEFLPLVEPVFLAIAEGRLQAVTSSLTLLETLVVPLRTGQTALAQRYEELLTASRGLRLVQIDLPLLRAAALLRARTSIKTPDAIQVAAALSTGCTSFLTNDRDLPAALGIKVLKLRSYL